MYEIYIFILKTSTLNSRGFIFDNLLEISCELK